ncbi:unnamed protein product [Ciceribacter selenitireducens ATCC BAA-1503]|uniref:Uncharacterized protein n=1 Tax=Ciceribacter selenitireducens ATCC BAA-1503 TaxID=1336235 RepID=A0A376AB49_9HYPH|nr:unnamed protein product [Ciceribacter selenitireducens ATCC BAA-1503]
MSPLRNRPVADAGSAGRGFDLVPVGGAGVGLVPTIRRQII